MPKMKDHSQPAHGYDLFPLIYDPDSQVVVFQRAIKKILIAAIDVEKQLFVQAEITSPYSVIGYAVPMHDSPDEPVPDLNSFLNLA